MVGPHIVVAGMYSVPDAPEPCHLIELTIQGSPGFDVAHFQQEEPGQPPTHWQTAYDERVLNQCGDTVLADW